MVSEQLKNAFREMTENLETILAKPSLAEFKQYCEEEIDEGIKAELPEDPRDLKPEELHLLAQIAINLMIRKAEELDLSDAEFLGGMIAMNIKMMKEMDTENF